jgi:hypothetical protein
MWKARIVAISVVVLVAGVGTGDYLWRRAHALPGATCGTSFTAAYDGGAPDFGPPYGTNPAALRCFATAALVCRAASIHLTLNSVDVTYNDVYAIRPGGTHGQCEVTDYGQFHMYSGNGQTTPVTVTHCQVIAIAAVATIACPGGRPILIPAGPQ